MLLPAAIAFSGACRETRRSLDEDCLKNDDCLSGICTQLHCASQPPTFDVPVVAEASFDAGIFDGPIDSTSADIEVPDSPDASSTTDGEVESDTPADGTGDALESSSTDASMDSDESGD
jgi:hypothetical protein